MDVPVYEIEQDFDMNPREIAVEIYQAEFFVSMKNRAAGQVCGGVYCFRATSELPWNGVRCAGFRI